jgi:hypothetical protein
MSDTQPTQPDPEPAEATPPSTGSGRFAQYDKTLQRFVGGVVGKRSDVDKSLRVKGHAYEVREV